MTTPLLRAPPFPGVRVPALAIPGASELVPDPQGLFAAIRARRVGGTFWLPAHRGAVPATIVRPRRGDAGLPADALVLRGDTVDPWSVLPAARTVIAHGDDEWLALARIAGVDTVALSQGRYAGDDDALAAVIAGSGWGDPFTGAPTTIARILAILGDWRDAIDRNRTIAVACGIARWKRREIGRFLWAPRPFAFRRGDIAAIRAAQARGGAIAYWPSRVPAGFPAQAAARGVPTIRIEDGFVRSVGLGSALFPPMSVSLDATGIYYDPACPSDLETILQTAEMPPALLARADALRAAIVAARIGKYGAGGDDAFPPRDRTRRLVLVAGQVEDDLSVRLGGGAVAGNRDLIARARALEPDAEIWFRPHPDVDAGHRRGAVPDTDALRHADRVVRGGAMAALLDRVDGVHVLTSLTGFEALLRGCAVTVHGAPFYAGWGLTRDRGPPLPRRTRRLDLAMLVAGTLILYPRYLDPVTGLPCPAELLVARMAAQATARHTWLTRLRAVQGRLMRGRR